MKEETYKDCHFRLSKGRQHFSAFKSAWNSIKSNVRKVFLFFYGRRGTLEFFNNTIHSNQITLKRDLKLKRS